MLLRFDLRDFFGGVPASRALESFLTNRGLRAVVEPWIPRRAADWVRRIRTSNMRKAPPLGKVLYDSKLQVVKHALGTHTTISRVQGAAQRLI